jgi:hypothetical protein
VGGYEDIKRKQGDELAQKAHIIFVAGNYFLQHSHFCADDVSDENIVEV